MYGAPSTHSLYSSNQVSGQSSNHCRETVEIKQNCGLNVRAVLILSRLFSGCSAQYAQNEQRKTNVAQTLGGQIDSRCFVYKCRQMPLVRMKNCPW